MRMETAPTDTMLDALSAALFKTTGDEKFKVEKKEAAVDPRDVSQRTRETFVPNNKYNVPQIGDKPPEDYDDCMA